MIAPQEVSVFLNNALKATHYPAELDAEAPLPESVREMPDQVTGRFVSLEPTVTHDIETAWKRVMMLNATQVLYTFSFDPVSGKFSARKR
jgi:hypothetical protein